MKQVMLILTGYTRDVIAVVEFDEDSNRNEILQAWREKNPRWTEVNLSSQIMVVETGPTGFDVGK